MAKLSLSEKQEQRILEKRREELSKQEQDLIKQNSKLENDKKVLENGIFRLKDDYARHSKMLKGLEDRKLELEAKLDVLNEELKAKEKEYGETNQ